MDLVKLLTRDLHEHTMLLVALWLSVLLKGIDDTFLQGPTTGS